MRRFLQVSIRRRPPFIAINQNHKRRGCLGGGEKCANAQTDIDTLSAITRLLDTTAGHRYRGVFSGRQTKEKCATRLSILFALLLLLLRSRSLLPDRSRARPRSTGI